MRYPLVVDIAWNVTEKMVKDWQKNPFIFSTEKDIQAELYSRLTAAYKLIGNEYVGANYAEYEHLNITQEWNRVCCEYNMIYDWEEKDDACCRPDIVVWDDIDDENSPPDKDDDKNFPIAWACEIKYSGTGGSLSAKEFLENTKKLSDWDLGKLRRLVDRGDLRYACALHLSLSRSLDLEEGYLWEKHEKEGRIWICAAQLPRIPTT